MFIRWQRKGGKPQRIDNVISVFVASTGDINFHWLCKGKVKTNTMIRCLDFDYACIQDKEK